jgi:hypothetical protein
LTASSAAASQIPNLVQVFNLDRDGNVGRIAAIEEVFNTNLDGNRADNLAEARNLEILHFEYLEPQGAELFADEPHLPVAQVNAVKVPEGQCIAN